MFIKFNLVVAFLHSLLCIENDYFHMDILIVMSDKIIMRICYILVIYNWKKKEGFHWCIEYELLFFFFYFNMYSTLPKNSMNKIDKFSFLNKKKNKIVLIINVVSVCFQKWINFSLNFILMFYLILYSIDIMNSIYM